MKSIGYLALLAAVAAGGSAGAATPATSGSSVTASALSPFPFYSSGYGYGWWPHAATVRESYARGLADVIRAQGDYNLATSAAAVNFTEARRRQIENDNLWVRTYFEMRDFNRAHHDAEIRRQRSTPESLARLAQAGKPKPLTNHELDAVTGRIRWPILLTAADFDPQRAVIERIFASRAYHGVLGAGDFLTAVHTIDDMSAILADRVTAVPPQVYVTARTFLRSLAYEARMPAG